ncbi:MAG: fumarylacetoacetate hydrolase family protein, partial [Chloroflexota bacterium]
MRYITFTPKKQKDPRYGILKENNEIIEISNTPDMPQDLVKFIAAGEETWDNAIYFANNDKYTYILDEVKLHSPLLRPPSLRDFYAFEEHVATANANRAREVPKVWYQIPVFYFSNPYATLGHGDPISMPSYTQELDYELEVACIIGKAGMDIKPEEAEDYIFGYTIFNDWSARDEQRKEMSVGLGPAKGKDFASSFGPTIITADELADKHTGRPGIFDLEMTAKINDKEYSRGNWKTLHYSFGEMIARASDNVMLSPGDIIGSGTVGTGCLLELTKNQGPWLAKGDQVTLEIERLGSL